MNKSNYTNFMMIVLLSLCTVSLAGNTITVGQGGSFNYSTIQDAVNAAVHGDTVLVAPGTYTGTGNKNITFSGKSIIVKSSSGPQGCIIDCQNSGRGFSFQNGENASAVLEGFTIKNGNMSRGGGLYISSASPTVKSCIISGNYSSGSSGLAGAGAYCSSSNASFTNCIFYNNSTPQDGGGLYNYSSNVTVKNCTFAKNSGDDGAAIFNYVSSNAYLSNCIVWGNTSIYNIIGNQSSSHLYYTGSDISGTIWNGTGSSHIDNGYNINADPLFENIAAGLLNLMPNSPCIDAGIDCGVNLDILGNSRPFDYPMIDNNGAILDFDMGAYEAVPEPLTVSLLVLGGLMIRRK